MPNSLSSESSNSTHQELHKYFLTTLTLLSGRHSFLNEHLFFLLLSLLHTLPVNFYFSEFSFPLLMLPNVACLFFKPLNLRREHQSRKQANKQKMEWNRRSKSWSQTATTRRTLQVYLPVTMRNLIQIFRPNLPVFNCPSISAQFTYLHYVLPRQHALSLSASDLPMYA